MARWHSPLVAQDRSPVDRWHKRPAFGQTFPILPPATAPLDHLASHYAAKRRRFTWLIATCVATLATCVATPALQAQPAATPLDPQHVAKVKQGLELFQKEVRPVLVGRCVKCHGGDKTEAQFDLNTREGLLKAGADGVQVVAGKPAESRLVKLIAHTVEPSMPEDGAKLPDNQIAAIGRWIELGAPYDKPLVEKESRPDAWVAKRIDPEAKEFWSFQPLRRVEPPPAANAAWSRNPLDRFLWQALTAKGLAPNSPASRRQWIRRVHFDLVGLPPAPADVERFVADNDPQAHEKVVDRLLESPHYGERWGRHWLDAARFAESHGFEQDYDRPHAFHYRDFVIQALNRDLPYDEFVRWQIAGDEIAPHEPLAMMATGFLGAGVFPTQLTEKEFEPARYDELDDMVATLGTSMLGLTIGCARCHDHKFDPIPAADYYRMVATFATAIRSNVELELDSSETAAAKRTWELARQPLADELQRWESQQLPARFDAWLADRRAKAAAKPPANDPAKVKGDAPSDAAAKAATDTASDPAKHWLTLDLVSAISAGKATLSKQADGSYLATGANVDFDTYTLVAETYLPSLRALRLDALPDPSMTKGGPGRAFNGNFALGSLAVSAEPLDRSKPAAPVKLVKPRATFEQNNGTLSIAASLDTDPKSGWAIDPQFGKPQAAAFEFAEPVGYPQGTRLTVTLKFTVNNQHNLGRTRLAITSAAEPLPLDAAPRSQLQTELLAELDRTAGDLPAALRQRALAWYRGQEPEWVALSDKLAKHDATKPQPKKTQVMVVSENVKPIPHHADGRGFPHFYKDTFFLKRGDVTQRHGPATPDFLQILLPARDPNATPGAALARWQVAAPPEATTSYRRRALANWLTDAEQGAGQLLARVIVNRLWHHHFGRGIVATPNDFGRQGLRPSHPELLDYLATELIRGGWKLKPIHRLMLSTAAYRQGSQLDEADQRVDPENQWLWRFPPARLQAEIIRDNMLAVSGQLDPKMFGPGSLDEGHKRRSIYFMIKRSRLIASMQLFDAPEPLVSVGGRPSTTIAPQALMFLNSPHVRGYAKGFAKRLLAEQAAAPAPAAAPTPSPAAATPGAKPAAATAASFEPLVTRGYLTALARPPAAEELRDDAEFLAGQAESYRAAGNPQPVEAALADFCQVLMSLNEFIFIE